MQVINQSLCPILGVRVYTPLANDLDVVCLCIKLNEGSARTYFKTIQN
jgi:hypothetical protein